MSTESSEAAMTLRVVEITRLRDLVCQIIDASQLDPDNRRIIILEKDLNSTSAGQDFLDSVRRKAGVE